MTATTQPVRASARGMKTFLLIWLGELISILGSGLTGFALSVWIYQQTGQATPLAISTLLATLPRLLLGPLAGSLADRWDRRRLMILADTGSALTTLVAMLLLQLGNLQVWQIYFITLGNALFSAFQEPAYMASVTMLVPHEQLARASGLIQTAQSLQLIACPILAGALFVAVGIEGIILIDFITFFFAVGALLVVRIPQPSLSEPENAKTDFWHDAILGWKYLKDRPGLFGLLWFFALVNFLLNLSSVLMAPLVLSFGNPATLGVVETVAGIGMLAGSLAISAWGGPRRRIVGLLAFIALAGAGLFVVGLRPDTGLVSAGLFLMLACVALASGCSQPIFQTKIDPAVQGRTFAIRGVISQSMMPLAYSLAGPLADRAFNPLFAPGGWLATTWLGAWLGVGNGRGVAFIYVLCGIILMAATLATSLNPRIRNVEQELPDIAY